MENYAERVVFYIPPQARAFIEQIADAERVNGGNKVYPSDIIRRALAAYFADSDVSFEVDRGGWRGGKKEKSA